MRPSPQPGPSPAARLFQKTCYRLRSGGNGIVTALARKPWWRLLGMGIGARTVMTTMRVNWPHKVQIGADCVLEPEIFIKFDGVWSSGRAITIGDRTFLGRGTEFNIMDRVEIGPDSLIGSHSKFIDHNHGMAPGALIGIQRASHSPIVLGAGVWLGANVVVLEGVTIGDGAVIAAGAVVNRSVPANEVWGGIPARRLAARSAATGVPTMSAVGS
jgi:acetyltransferase-like isoleucine patch superfamily enzyme